jgi:hypothetical protein
VVRVVHLNSELGANLELERGPLSHIDRAVSAVENT